MSHPSAAQELADLGVDIIFAPTYWMATDSEPYVDSSNTYLNSCLLDAG